MRQLQDYYRSNSMGCKKVQNDLMTRFILNLPEAEMTNPNRFLYHILQAHWYFLRYHFSSSSKTQTSYDTGKEVTNLYEFGQWLLGGKENFHYTTLDVRNFFRNYYYQIPVCGAIIYKDETKSHWLVVRSGWAKRYGFPKGKINHGESDHDCAIREVKEETGLDISQYVDQTRFLEFQSKNRRVKFFIVYLPASFTGRLHIHDTSEIAECKWVSTSSALNIQYVEESRRAITLLPLSAAAAAPVSPCSSSPLVATANAVAS